MGYSERLNWGCATDIQNYDQRAKPLSLVSDAVVQERDKGLHRLGFLSSGIGVFCG